MLASYFWEILQECVTCTHKPVNHLQIPYDIQIFLSFFPQHPIVHETFASDLMHMLRHVKHPAWEPPMPATAYPCQCLQSPRCQSDAEWLKEMRLVASSPALCLGVSPVLRSSACASSINIFFFEFQYFLSLWPQPISQALPSPPSS